MTPYAQLPAHKPEEFMRTIGLSQEDFLPLHRNLSAYLGEQKALNPLTRQLTLAIFSVVVARSLGLSAEGNADNKALSKQCVFIGHVNRRCKIFRIVKTPWA
jgi:hypothetical protein